MRIARHGLGHGNTDRRSPSLRLLFTPGKRAKHKFVFRIVGSKVRLRPVTMTLEDTFGSIVPHHRPEDFKALRDVAIEEHVEKVVEEMQD